MTAPAIQVVQGAFHISRDPEVRLSTVLGSCVAACLWDGTAAVGGMNHFLLPQSHPGGEGQDNRYGAHAMEMLINALLRAGAQRGRLQAKLFGGARITAHLRDIGGSNAAFARAYLQDEAIPCRAASLGGSQARRILFHPTTGRAWQLRIPAMELEELPPPRPLPPAGVELF